MDKAQSSKIKAQRVFKNMVVGNINAPGIDWRATIVGGIILWHWRREATKPKSALTESADATRKSCEAAKIAKSRQGILSTGFSQPHLKKDCLFGSLFQGLLFKAEVGASATPSSLYLKI